MIKLINILKEINLMTNPFANSKGVLDALSKFKALDFNQRKTYSETHPLFRDPIYWKNFWEGVFKIDYKPTELEQFPTFPHNAGQYITVGITPENVKFLEKELHYYNFSGRLKQVAKLLKTMEIESSKIYIVLYLYTYGLDKEKVDSYNLPVQSGVFTIVNYNNQEYLFEGIYYISSKSDVERRYLDVDMFKKLTPEELRNYIFDNSVRWPAEDIQEKDKLNIVLGKYKVVTDQHGDIYNWGDKEAGLSTITIKTVTSLFEKLGATPDKVMIGYTISGPNAISKSTYISAYLANGEEVIWVRRPNTDCPRVYSKYGWVLASEGHVKNLTPEILVQKLKLNR